MTRTAVHELAVNGGKPVRTKPFPAWPSYDDTERQGLLRVLESGMWGGRRKPSPTEVTAFEREFAEFHEAPAALAVTNGTHALQLALDLAGVRPGDHVLVPALTPIPTSNAVRQCGAVPIPVDVDPHTFCVDPDRLAQARTDRVTAVVVVHLSGHIADMDGILRWADRSGVAVVQDAAHAHGALWKGHGIGALGTIATFSFMQSKVMTAGEGGALLLPNGDLYPEAFARHCLGRAHDGGPRFLTASSNYRMGEFAAAVLRAQLGRLAEQNRRRDQRWRELVELVARIPGVTPQGRDPRCTVDPHYVAALELDGEPHDGVSRDTIVAALRAEGITVNLMNPPIYRLPAFWDGPVYPRDADVHRFAEACPHSERLGAWAINLPHWTLLGDHRDVQDIADALAKVLGALMS
ncbi:MAG TPA: DegT/DnrJ/EryC1/StrS family aminotransferase [Pseudonocardiaceae bacterium]|nr:DegT/DnrJ/EryC1/StrS family aminotransferase [Pseudonocardiaceae bacterium]